jgi:filamentous hemagglutinin
MATFADSIKRSEHFRDHGAEVGASDERTYEFMAERFLVDPRPIHVMECLRNRGDTVRFDPATDEFGVLAHDGSIRTYYKPIPCINLPPSLLGIKRCHNLTSNLDYFNRECMTH